MEDTIKIKCDNCRCNMSEEESYHCVVCGADVCCDCISDDYEDTCKDCE